ncbi:MAG: hypothetical protein HYX38_11655 [Rhodospirillales bacterium]|nr:hypothetical protein [Rhodospirillales bacterium]
MVRRLDIRRLELARLGNTEANRCRYGNRENPQAMQDQAPELDDAMGSSAEPAVQ